MGFFLFVFLVIDAIYDWTFSRDLTTFEIIQFYGSRIKICSFRFSTWYIFVCYQKKSQPAEIIWIFQSTFYVCLGLHQNYVRHWFYFPWEIKNSRSWTKKKKKKCWLKVLLLYNFECCQLRTFIHFFLCTIYICKNLSHLFRFRFYFKAYELF